VEKQTPQAWVGQDLLLARAGSADPEFVNLREVNDWGLVYTYKEAEVSEPIFLPWSAVSWIRPSAPEDRGESEVSG
jgi:hypothetical protein